MLINKKEKEYLALKKLYLGERKSQHEFAEHVSEKRSSMASIKVS